MRSFLCLLPLPLLVACGHEPAPKDPSAPVPVTSAGPPSSSAPIRVSGTHGGKPFKFECTKLSDDIASEDSNAHYGKDGPDVWLSCIDKASELDAHVHIKKPGVGDFTPNRDESSGRVGVVSHKNKGFEVLKTSDEDGTGKGSIHITKWDPQTRHIAGTATMTWDKDATGKPGSVKVDFELSKELQTTK